MNTNEMNEGEQLKELLFEKKINLSELAEKLGVARGTIYYQFRSKVVSDDFKKLLKDKAGLTFSPVSMVVNDPGVLYNDKPKNIIHVPIAAFGGFLVGYESEVYTSSLERYSLPGIHGKHYSFEVEGMSMYRSGDRLSMEPGDWVITKEVEQLNYMTKGKAYVVVTIDGIIVKLFDRIEAGTAHFISLNKEYPAVKLPLKSIKRVYFVTQILKKA